MPVSEHVYCVAMAFKMTEWVKQRICIKFCVNLEHSSMESIQMIEKAAAMGKWWVAASSQQHGCSCAEFFGEASNHPGDSAPLQPRFDALWLLSFPKSKITSEREEISDHWWGSEKYDGATDIYWENCVRSQDAYFEGDRGIIVLCTPFLVSCSINVSCFSYLVNLNSYENSYIY